MLDLKLLRDNPDIVKEALKKRGDKTDLKTLLSHEKERRTLLTQLEKDSHSLKSESDAFGKQKDKKGGVPKKLKDLSLKVKTQEQKVKKVEDLIREDASVIPNIPHESVPVGGPDANKIVREVGEKVNLSFNPKTHIELSEKRGLINFSRGAKVAGSHFPLYTGLGAKLERALSNWMIDLHTKKHGYTEIYPPFLVNRTSMFATGQLPKFEEDMYRLKDDDLFLVPTSEVPLINMHRDEVLDESNLPLNYVGYSACFRREAGSYGKDTRGLVRVHQFNKVELIKITTPESSYDALEEIVKNAEAVLKGLGLHYRVVLLSTKEISFAASKCYDLEVWAPGMKQYLEVSSCSNCEAFQARRANIRYRSKSTRKVSSVHILNGSGVALARVMVALLETHQQQDGTIKIPDVLKPYLDNVGNI